MDGWDDGVVIRGQDKARQGKASKRVQGIQVCVEKYSPMPCATVIYQAFYPWEGWNELRCVTYFAPCIIVVPGDNT